MLILNCPIILQKVMHALQDIILHFEEGLPGILKSSITEFTLVLFCRPQKSNAGFFVEQRDLITRSYKLKGTSLSFPQMLITNSPW